MCAAVAIARTAGIRTIHPGVLAMTRHGQRESRATAPALWPMEPLVAHTTHDADDMQMPASPGPGGDTWERKVRPAPSSTGCGAARKPTKAQAEIIKSP